MPVVMAIVTQATRRWGNRIGGLIASMPWIAGPILLFFILEQGKAFGIQSIPGILTGISSLVCFCYSYARLAGRFGWLATLLLSYAVYVLVALLLTQVRVNLWTGYGMAMGSILLCLRFFPAPAAQPSSVRRLPYDMLIRMVVATLFVVFITELAHWVGPTWSGILTPFPLLRRFWPCLRITCRVTRRWWLCCGVACWAFLAIRPSCFYRRFSCPNCRLPCLLCWRCS